MIYINISLRFHLHFSLSTLDLSTLHSHIVQAYKVQQKLYVENGTSPPVMSSPSHWTGLDWYDLISSPEPYLLCTLCLVFSKK